MGLGSFPNELTSFQRSDQSRYDETNISALIGRLLQVKIKHVGIPISQLTGKYQCTNCYEKEKITSL